METLLLLLALLTLPLTFPEVPVIIVRILPS
jgi:hypothetical protein